MSAVPSVLVPVPAPSMPAGAARVDISELLRMTGLGDGTVEDGDLLPRVGELLAGLSEQVQRWQTELAQVRTLVTALTDQVGRSGHLPDDPLPDDAPREVLSEEEAVQLVVEAVAGGARRMSHVRSSHSPFLDRLKARDTAWADPRLSVRELIGGPAGTRTAEAGQDRRLVRTTWTRLGEVLVIDDAVALIPSSGGEDLQVTVVRQPAVVRQLAQFAQAAWIQAACPQEPVSLPDGTEIEHRIVQLLAEGAKDETVARRLGISLRTCRRHIAEILAQLGASSRFQAGVRAAAPGTVAAGPGSYGAGSYGAG